MMTFLKCASLCEAENSDTSLERFVSNLNNEFGKRSCSCHPDVTWRIAVDLMKDCQFKFHKTYEKNPECQFWQSIEREILQDIERFILINQTK